MIYSVLFSGHTGHAYIVPDHPDFINVFIKLHALPGIVYRVFTTYEKFKSLVVCEFNDTKEYDFTHCAREFLLNKYSNEMLYFTSYNNTIVSVIHCLMV